MNIRNVLLFLIAIALCSCGGQATKSNDLVLYAESNDPELEQAKQEALENLDYFIESFTDHINDTIFQFSLKIDFVDNGEHEHMWVSLNKIDSGKFEGFLGNEPLIVKNIKYGDLVTFTKNQIEDWIIVDTKTNNWEGGYSVKVFQRRQQ